MGLASISAHRKFVFRVDPYNVTWSYSLRTHTDNTYGGKVIQLLGVSLGDLSVDIVTGAGGLEEAKRVMGFFREMYLWQRDQQQLATFSYPQKKYNLQVWAKNITMQDSLTNVDFPIQMTFAIQEDLGGTLTKTSMRKELSKLADGIGYDKNVYNDPMAAANIKAAQQMQQITTNPALNPTNYLPNFMQKIALGDGSGLNLSAEQLSNAKTIINVAFTRGLGIQGAVIGVMTAITESTLNNVNHGDTMGPSSRGLFQQMPQYWGPVEVIMDPAGAAGLFYDALVKIDGWQSMEPWVAAQKVQQSEFSDGSNYRSNLSWAQEIVSKLTGGTVPG
jgi:hypothetical protein